MAGAAKASGVRGAGAAIPDAGASTGVAALAAEGTEGAGGFAGTGLRAAGNGGGGPCDCHSATIGAGGSVDKEEPAATSTGRVAAAR